jgi:aryl-alcohol dehydrogenase-like predicted oxidoreductase
LSGHYTENTTFEKGDWRGNSPEFTGEGFKRNLRKVEKLKEVAARYGITVAQLALAYVLAHPALTTALVGVRKPDHILRALPAVEVELDDATLQEIRTIAG